MVFLQEPRIHNAVLIFTQDNGLFYVRVRNPETGLMAVDLTQLAVPATVQINPSSSVFEHSAQTGTTWRSERVSWAWELFLHFNEDVSLEAFENAWAAVPIRIPKDDVHGLSPVRLEIRSVKYSIPPAQEPANGTQAIVSFDAITQRP